MPSTFATPAPTDLKRAAAIHAAEWIADGTSLGLGTGSTVDYLLLHIAEQQAEGRWRDLRCVSTSRATSARARELGISLCSLAECPAPDLTIDGADEVGPNLALIKGLGGALLREKIVASASHQLVIIADHSKRVDRLGSTVPLPVEVDPFALPVLLPFFRSVGSEPRVRSAPGGTPLVTDGGNGIVDLHFATGIDDPERLHARLKLQPGVVETGLFLGMATAAVIASPGGVVLLRRGAASEEPGG